MGRRREHQKSVRALYLRVRAYVCLQRHFVKPWSLNAGNIRTPKRTIFDLWLFERELLAQQLLRN